MGPKYTLWIAVTVLSGTWYALDPAAHRSDEWSVAPSPCEVRGRSVEPPCEKAKRPVGATLAMFAGAPTPGMAPPSVDDVTPQRSAENRLHQFRRAQ